MITDMTDESALWIAKDAGDNTARDDLIEWHIALAQSLADRYRGRGIPAEDLHQVAAMGLVRAVDRFDHTRSVPFPAFAVPTILGELRRHFRDHGWVVKVPRDLQTLGARIREVTEALTHKEGAPPSVDRVAEEVGAELEEVIFAMKGLDSAFRPIEVPPCLLTLEEEDDLVEDMVIAHELMRHLQDRERLIVYLRFWGDLSQREIADTLEISQVRVSELLRRSLREMLRAAGPDTVR